MELLFGFISNQNHKIRFALCHCFGQFAKDLKPNFQNEYKEQVLPELISLLDDQSVRVRGHAAAALTNFIEGCYI